MELFSSADLDGSSDYSGKQSLCSCLRVVVGKGFVTTEIVHESVGANGSANAWERSFYPSGGHLFFWQGSPPVREKDLSRERSLARMQNTSIFVYLVGKCCR